MKPPRSTIGAALREPLIPLAALGVAIFALHHALAEPTPATSDDATLHLDAAYVDGLVAQRHAAGRSLDREAVESDYVREEVLVRSARRLGLDRGDPIVRRRLVERMELWLAGQVDPPEPTDAQVRAAMAEQAASAGGRGPERWVFEHRFFSRERADAVADANAALEDASGEAPQAGDAFALGARQASSRAQLEGRFGAGFAAALEGLEVGAWDGPVESALGVHLVRVIERRRGRAPRATESATRARLREEARAAAVDGAVERLRRDYEVVRQSAADTER